MIHTAKKVSSETMHKTFKIAEQFYGSESHPDHIPIKAESAAKLDSISDNWFNCAFDDNNEPISWIVVIPTSIALMKDFITAKITEKQLFDSTSIATPQEALYLCSAFTIPEYRRQGLAMRLILETIGQFEQSGTKELFAWIYSPEGEQMVTTMQQRYGRKIYIRKGSAE